MIRYTPDGSVDRLAEYAKIDDAWVNAADLASDAWDALDAHRAVLAELVRLHFVPCVQATVADVESAWAAASALLEGEK